MEYQPKEQIMRRGIRRMWKLILDFLFPPDVNKQSLHRYLERARMEGEVIKVGEYAGEVIERESVQC